MDSPPSMETHRPLQRANKTPCDQPCLDEPLLDQPPLDQLPLGQPSWHQPRFNRKRRMAMLAAIGLSLSPALARSTSLSYPELRLNLYNLHTSEQQPKARPDQLRCCAKQLSH